MAQQPTIVSGQNIIVPAPQAGDNVTITSSPSGNLTFEFDINTAEPSRVDNDLVLQTPDGSVTIGNFFAVGEESLPTLTLTDGVVVDATDFFDGSGVDMTTAAGPAGARADGSGTNYDDGAGALIDGIDRLGSLGNFHWGRDVEFGGDDLGLAGPATLTLDFTGGNGLLLDGQSINESEGGFNLRLNLDKPAAGTITVTIQMGGNATLLNNAVVNPDIEEYNSDANLPTGPGYSYDPASGLLTVTIPAGASQVTVPFTLIDDHISFENDETLSFTVIGVTGPVVVEGVGTATITITDDNIPADGDDDTFINELDGPVVGLSAPDNQGAATSKGGELKYAIELKDPHNPAENYEGYSKSGVLSQDMTITIETRGTGEHPATYGEEGDYVFDLSGILALDGVKSAEVNPVTGTITIELYGKVGLDGKPHDNPPFELEDVKDLIITAKTVDNDSITERHEESFSLNVASTVGNESQPNTKVEDGFIKPDTEDLFDGPVVSLKSPETIAESHPDDSDAGGKFKPMNNMATHNIELSKPCEEDIRVVVGLTAKNGANDQDGLDFEWANKFVAKDANGQIMVGADGSPIPVTCVPYGGSYIITIPAGAKTVDFGVTIIDDLREHEGREGDKNGEGYEVELELLYVDANDKLPNDPDYDLNTALPDGEAKLSAEQLNDNGKLTTETKIIDDVRPDFGQDDHLNPPAHDGPWVNIAFVDGGEGMAGSPEEGWKVNESHSSGDAGKSNSIKFGISLTAPDKPSGEGDPYSAIENVTVTVAFKGVPHSDGSNTFTPFDLFKPGASDLNMIKVGSEDYFVKAVLNGNGTYTLEVYKDNSFDSNSLAEDVSLNYKNGNLELTVTVPKDSTGIDVTIPVNDDPLGGADESSKHDRPTESFTLEIISVDGNEARVENPSSGKITIVDDKSGVQDFEGMDVGISWIGSSDLKEGITKHFKLDLTYEGDEITKSENNPYAGYTVGSLLPDDVTITMNFSDTPSSGVDGNQDVVYTYYDSLWNLLKAGKVSLKFNGKDYDESNYNDLEDALTPADAPQGFFGEVELTLKGGAFGSGERDWQNIKFEARVIGDNISEEKFSDESISVKITDVGDMNETHLDKDNAEIGGDILDRADGKLTFAAKDVDGEGGNFTKPGTEADDFGRWAYTVKVRYDDDEKVNDLLTQDTIVKLPGEAVHFQLNIADSDNMQNGEEYKVSAYSLFLSMNNITAKEISEEEYVAFIGTKGREELLADANKPFDSDDKFSGKILVDFDGDWDGSGPNSFDVYAPPSAFEDDYTISFDIERGEHGGVSGGDGKGFTIEIVKPENPMGEIVKVEGGVIHATDPGDEIHLSISSKGNSIYEDPAMGAEGSNIATYTVNFQNKIGDQLTGGKVVGAADITFDLVFSSKSSDVNFDFNLKDNAYLDTWHDDPSGGTEGQGIGDVGLYILDAKGEQVIYDSEATMLAALNDQFQAKFGVDAAGNNNVEVKGIVVKGGEITFEVFAKEGVDLSKGIEIQFVALDDSIDDNNEIFNVKVTNPDTGGKLNIAIEGNRDSDITITDESSGYESIRNGFALSLENSSGREANLEGMGNGKYLHVTTRAFVLDNDSNTAMTLEALYGKFEDYQKALNTSVTAYEDLTPQEIQGLTSGTDFADFMAKFYAPSQNITVNYALDGRTAGEDDYVNSTSHTIGHNDWKLVIDAEGNLYYETIDGKGIPIELIKDHASEGDESFDIKLSSSSGNESRPCEGKDFKEGDWTINPTPEAGLTILDVHDGPRVIEIKPAGGLVMEPVDHDHGPKPKLDKSGEPVHDSQGNIVYEEHKAEPREVAYQIELSEAAFESMAIFFSFADSGAKYGEDFVFGEGVLYCKKEGGTVAVHKLDENGKPGVLVSEDDLKALLSPSQVYDLFQKNADTGYFVLAQKGQTVVDFGVNILDDNDTVNGRGADVNPETIVIGVENVIGSEATVLGEHEHRIPWDTSVAFKYSFIEGNEKVTGIVDPKTNTFTTEDGTVYTFGDSANPWLPGTPPTAAETMEKHQTDILDDMRGPIVSLGDDGRIAWDGDLENLRFGLGAEDICQEDVFVTIDFLGEGLYSGKGTDVLFSLTVTLPAGTPGFTDVNFDNLKGWASEWDAWLNNPTYDEPTVPRVELSPGSWKNLKNAGKYFEKLEKDSFYMQIKDSDGGETRPDQSLIYVDYDAGGSTMVIDNFTSNTIKETFGGSAKDYASYSFTVSNINNTTVKNIQFDIVFFPGSAGVADMHNEKTFTGSGKVHVRIHPSALKGHTGDPEFIVKADDKGEPQVYLVTGREADGTPITGTTPLPKCEVTGTLPSAKIDDLIEGDEYFQAIITNPKGFDNDSAPAKTTVTDETRAKVLLFDKDGNQLTGRALEEGTTLDVVAKLVLVDESGNPIGMDGNPLDLSGETIGWVFVKPGEDMEFEIDYSPKGEHSDADKATYNYDYHGDLVVVIDSKTGTGSFEIKIHEDMLTEKDEEFTITLKPKNQGTDEKGNTVYDNKELVDQIVSSTEGTTITIKDTINGPIIRTEVDTSVSENSELVVKFGSWSRESIENNSESPDEAIRQVVEEDVTLTFELTSAGGGLVISDDIQSITYDGVTATFNQETGEIEWSSSDHPQFTIKGNDNAGYTLVLIMDKGTAMGKFTITPRNDRITEPNEFFKIELKETSGSETTVFEGNPEGKVQIKDDMNGLKPSISPLTGVEGEYGEGPGIRVSLTGGPENEPNENVVMTFTLDSELASLDKNGTVAITLPDGEVVEYNLESGAITPPVAQGVEINHKTVDGKVTLELTVPPAHMQAGDLDVRFPIMDNSVIGENAFKIEFGIKGGEITFRNEYTFNSTFSKEVGAIGGHGGITEFKLFYDPEMDGVPNKGGLETIDAKMNITISDVDESVIGKILVNGTEVSYTSDPVKGIVLAEQDLADEYRVEIVYKKTTDADELQKIVDAKKNLSVNGDITLLGNSVNVIVTDEDPEFSDSIMLSYVFNGGNNDIVEGTTVNGQITITMPNLPGDQNTVQGDMNAIYFQFKVPLGADGKPYDIEWGSWPEGVTITPLSSSYPGVYHVRVAGGTEIPPGGKFEIPFTVEVRDNALVDNPEFNMGIAMEKAEAYEGITIDDKCGITTANKGDWQVVDDPTPDGPVFSLEAPTNTAPTEGTDVWANVRVSYPDGNPKTTGEAIDLSFTLKGEPLPTGVYVNGNWCAVDQGTGKFTYTLQKGNNISDDPTISVRIPIPDNALKAPDAGNPYKLTLDEATGKGTGVGNKSYYENISVDPSKDSFELAVKDEVPRNQDGFELGLKVTEGMDELAYAITLAKVGNVGNALPTDLPFTLNIDGMTNSQLQSIAGQLQELDNVAAELKDGKVTVTLEKGYNWKNGVPFTVDVDTSVTNNYKVAISDVISDLEVARVAPEAESGLYTQVDMASTADNTTLAGGYGADSISIGHNNVTVDAGAGDDMISINAGAAYQGGSVFDGGAGFDSISYAGLTGGGIFADLANGQISFGNKTNPTWTDTIKNIEEFTGTDSGDEIHLGGGVTTVHGGGGDDRIFGSDANETIYAGSGTDLIYGGKGNDTMHAGDGQDTFAWKADDLGAYTDTIVDFKLDTTDGDKLQFDAPSIDALIKGALEKLGETPQTGETTYQYNDGEGNSFGIDCGTDSCTLTLGTDSGNQIIQLDNVDFGGLSNANDLALLIETIIKIDTGG